MRKPVKPKAAPKVKHKAFTSFMHRLQGEDWVIGIHNPNDRTAAYFLAEPTTPITSKTMNTNQHPGKLSGYMVSALSRQGLFETTIAGLPRKFKTVEDATEWLEGQIEQYDGDEAVEVIADFKSDKPWERKYKAVVDINTPTYHQFDEVDVEVANKMHAVEKTARTKPSKVNKGKAPTSHEKKFKTSREELDSLGLGDLFDD